MKNISCMLFILLIVFPISLTAKIDTVYVLSDNPPSIGSLNVAVQAAIDSGKLSSTIFELEPYGYYVLSKTITVPKGEHLTIISQDPGTTQQTAPPQIVWTVKLPSTWPTYEDYINDTTRNYFFNCFGDLTLKNVWVFCADELGERVASCIIFQDSPQDADGRRCEFDGVILDYFPCPPRAGGTVTVACTNFRGFFKNCYWKNNTDIHLRYYGRAVSFPYASTGWQGDSVIFENCTFANIGYVLMQEEGEYHDYVKFNHCTFLNVVMYPLESGWWNKLSVTNSIFVNTYMFGDITALSSFGDGEPNGSTIRIDSVSRKYYNGAYTFPFTEKDRRILFSNSSHYLEKWIRDWMWNNPWSLDLRIKGRYDEIPMPQPMLSPGTLKFFDSTFNGQKIFPFMNKANLYDSTNPGVILPPSDTGGIKSFLFRRWYDSSDTLWAWKPENSFNRLWPLEENLAYTNDTLKTAGMGGFPLGDLYHWWPEKYQRWKAQETTENDTINKWLLFGFGAFVGVTEYPGFPEKFELSQNYPNPFNPTTTIKYAVPASPFSQKGERGGFVTLKVYNLLGQEVAILFEGVRDPGEYQVTFDGSKFASGVYLYRLSASNHVQAKKLVLVK